MEILKYLHEVIVHVFACSSSLCGSLLINLSPKEVPRKPNLGHDRRLIQRNDVSEFEHLIIGELLIGLTSSLYV